MTDPSKAWGRRDDPSSTGEERSDPSLGAAAARRAWDLLELGRRSERALGPVLAGDPAWHMLLELVVAAHGGRRLSVSDVCGGSLSAHSTAHRYLVLLERRDLVRRKLDDDDRRRQFVELTGLGSAIMQEILLA